MLRAMGLAFLSGVLVVGSPCTLPILPGVLTSLGASRLPASSGVSSRWHAIRAVAPVVLFAVGVAVALATTAGFGAWLARGLAPWRPPLALIPAALLAFAGLATLEWRPLLAVRLRPVAPHARGRGQALLTGLALGSGWAPCATPALAVAMLATAHVRSWVLALAVLTGYVLGVVTPLCAVAIGIAQIRVVRSALARAGRSLQVASGTALLLLSVLVGTGLWERLTIRALGWLA